MSEHTPTRPEQLQLLTPADVPLAFRLDERTRRSGLAHIAELRAIIARQSATRHLSDDAKHAQPEAGSRRIAA